MNPKISNFGLSRTFGGDQLEGNTNKVVGTYILFTWSSCQSTKFST